ncbi:gliding motility-associated C-terminal domain-containing protein [Hymenobacter sp. BT175]|uniref:gliding motility-associated C-terminal domain-containing protein n=1 Tax=Hymenobacter translucens TaxID=2886507 RepID=UPI001D0EC1A8|nr:gliding motility-associated C-terminal domain-containing protein [Hymenobacter translucens]MCC2544978.1 gliding motility-associated C-terminal domain-containing protein [Hymenobacter translucens]
MPHFYYAPFFCRLGFLLLLVLGARVATATHIVGGEMDLQHLSGSSYRLTLNLYFDALNGSSGALDSDLTVSIFDKGNNIRKQDVVLPLTSDTFVPYTNPACTSPSLSTKRLVYTRVIDLPASQYNSPAGYYAAVQRCCRNNGISNIQAPGDTGQTFYLEFPAVTRGGQDFFNSTPRIFPPLSDYACRGELFYYDFAGQDADKDSLVYELVTPLDGGTPAQPKPAVATSAPYREITWLPGRSTLSQIPGTPTLSIGRTSGRLTVQPSQLGLYVFGIKCSEYRRGEKIGEVRRDFQLKVLSCPRNTPPSMTVQTTGAGRPYREGLDTLRVRPGANRCFTLRFTDPDPTSRLSLSLSPVNFSTAALPTFTVSQGTVRTPGAPDTLVSQLCFPACFNTRGRVYLLDVIVGDDGCSLPKRDTVRLAFTAVPDPNSTPALTSNAVLPLRAKPGNLITFDLTATDADNDPITLEMTGRGFAPSVLGAQLTQSVSGNQTRGRFTWRVDCRAIDQPAYQFEFAAVASPCGDRQASTLVIPVQIDYQNTAPTLTTSLPAEGSPTAPPILIRRPLGGVFEATFEGLDTDNDQLTLTALGNGFDLPAVGMTFTPRNGPGRATATFRWDASCSAVQQTGLEVTFLLLESTCRPVSQSRTVRFEVISPDSLPFLPPNIITPNGDGLNDVFALPDLPPDFCESRFATVKIFSRWGNEVYRTTDRVFRWDGGRLPAGVYYYLIEYTDKKRFKGTITLSP